MFNLFKKKYTTGLLSKDPVDPRNYLLSELQPIAVTLPDSFDLGSQMSPVENQNGLGICYAMAGTGYQEFWNTKEYGSLIDLSERFCVWGTKKISGMTGIQADFLINALKAICQFGLALEQDYPNDFSLSWEKFIEEPPAEIKQKALEFRGKTYWQVNNDLESMKQAIFQNKCPLFVGMPWYESYNKPETDGKLPLPSGNKSGHAVLCIGWDNEKLWFKNSWGSNWGKEGYFYIPFADFPKYEIWDVRILLDLERPTQEMIGWVAENYLRFINQPPFKTGDLVSPIASLRLRTNPTIYAPILKQFTGQETLEIVGDEKISANNYIWRKVRVKI